MQVHKIPGRLEVEWNADARAIVDHWTDYNVTIAEFKDAVLVKGLNYAKSHGGRAWIVDSSAAKGNFTQECQALIDQEIFPAFARNGIKYFITINSRSALTQLTVKAYQAKTGPHGLKLVEVANVADAVAWLKAHAN